MARYVGLVIHGMGEQEKGSTLKEVGAPLAELIRRSGLDPKVALSVTPDGDTGPARAEITLSGGHTISLEEVWWARSFRPPSIRRVLSFWVGFWVATSLRDPHWLVQATAGVLFRNKGDVTLLQRLVAAVVVYAAFLLFLPLAAVLWFLSANPVRRFLPVSVSAAYEAVTNTLTGYLGDVTAYVDDAWGAAQIQKVFGRRLEALMEAAADQRFVIAHSLGAVVAHEGLLRAGRTAPAPEGGPMRLIAVGAPLNWMQRIVERESIDRLIGPLPGWVRLTYIAARHDPVALGDLDPSVAWAVTPPESLEVVNQQDIFSDHTTYWSNAEEVMAPILRIITDGRLSVRLRKGYRRLRVTVLAALKGLAWLLPAAVFVWMASTNWSEAFGAWAYGKAVLQTPIRLITEASAAKPWNQPNDLLRVFGGRWTLEHLALPVLASAYVAIAVSTVYNLAVKTLWDIWDRRSKFQPAPSDGDGPGQGEGT